MTHDERVKLYTGMQAAFDEELAGAKPQHKRIAVLEAALAAERVLVWFDLDLIHSLQERISTLEQTINTLRELAELHGAKIAEPPKATMH
jgi:hypothetical protein